MLCVLYEILFSTAIFCYVLDNLVMVMVMVMVIILCQAFHQIVQYPNS